MPSPHELPLVMFDEQAGHSETPLARPGFTNLDPDVLVEAGVSCAWCLTTARHVALVQDAEGAEGRWTCSRCCAPTLVRLTGEQVLRLALRPPLGLVVSFGTPEDNSA